jgi:glycosyltransferase involved in cell wall biosynthesis
MALQYENELTVIIPFLNEGAEVGKTLASIRETATGNPEIILINDASSDGYDYAAVARQYDCRYIEHQERMGVAASRDEGVELAETPFILLLDAHMEFYKSGWDLELVNILIANPESILCCQTRVLRETRENVKKDCKGFGARLSLGSKDLFKCVWNMIDHAPEEAVIEVPVVLGGAYAARKAYWQHLHGLRGLVYYGMDEELISLKCWIEGGRCLLLKDMVAGHIYRKAFPYEVKSEQVLNNKIFIIELFFDGDMKQELFRRLKAHYSEPFFTRVYEGRDRKMIDGEREYLRSISRKNLLFFLFKNEVLK